MGLDHKNERYIRLFVRDTSNWLLGPWQARAMLPLIMRKLDRVGVLDLGEEGAEALAVHTSMPLEIVEIGLEWWIKRGTLKLVRGNLVMPNFLEAQEASQDDAQRARESRARRRDLAMAEEKGLVTKRDGGDTKRDDSVTAPEQVSQKPTEVLPTIAKAKAPYVTKRDGGDTKRDDSVTEPGETVTRGHNQSLCAVPSRTVPSLAVQNSPAEPDPPPNPPVGGETKMRTLPASEMRLWGPAWIERYEQAAGETLGSTWAFDRKQLSVLEDLIGAHCVDKKRIEDWIGQIVPAFVRAARADEPKFWSSYQPKGLRRWLNESGGKLVAPPEYKPPPIEKEVAPPPPEFAAALKDMLAHLKDPLGEEAAKSSNGASGAHMNGVHIEPITTKKPRTKSRSKTP